MDNRHSSSAFIIHRRPYRESSQLIQLFTLEWGRVDAVARGTRGKGSRRGDKGELFQPLLVSLTGQGSLQTLTALESTAPAYQLADRALFGAMYMNELLSRLLGRDISASATFGAYWQSLKILARAGDAALEPLLREFELTLLGELGYGLDLCQDIGGTPIEAGALYIYRQEEGLQAIASPIRGRPCYAGEVLQRVARRDWTTDALACAKRLNRQAIQPLLGRRPLKSRELFLATRKEEQQ